MLLNGRISERSFRRWRRQPGLIGRLLSGFVLCLGQTEADARRLAALGAPKVACLGNLKFAAPPLPADGALLADLLERTADRPRWLAASTHAGEEAMAGRLHHLLAPRFPRLLTVIAPRHPARGREIADTLTAMGLTVARRSAGQMVGPATDVLLADTMGELGLFIRLAPLVFMGKSLYGEGGQNPLEPGRLGASVLFGPKMGNFVDIAVRMQQAGAALQVADEAALAAALGRRLADRTLAAAEGVRAREFASAEDRILDAVLVEIVPWLTKA
jgi:3-deoxy-D-manno-octulosonic-acid transferase